MLSPQGHIEHVLYGVDDGETFWAHTEPGAAPALVTWLDRMRFMMRVEVLDRTADFGLVWSRGSLPATGSPEPAWIRSAAGTCSSPRDRPACP